MNAALHQALTRDTYVPERMAKSMSQVADEVQWRDCVNTAGQTGGVMFARKESLFEKDKARQRVLDLYSTKNWPGPLSILTMPGLYWTFEKALKYQRERLGKRTRTSIHAIERDPAIYYGALNWIPRKTNGLIKQVSPHCIRTKKVHAYYFTTAESFISDENLRPLDAAWFDFTGTIKSETMAALRKFWFNRCMYQMTVTALNARFGRDTAKRLETHGSLSQWIINSFPGIVVDNYSYRDGYSPMVQVTVRKES